MSTCRIASPLEAERESSRGQGPGSGCCRNPRASRVCWAQSGLPCHVVTGCAPSPSRGREGPGARPCLPTCHPLCLLTLSPPPLTWAPPPWSRAADHRLPWWRLSLPGQRVKGPGASSIVPATGRTRGQGAHRGLWPHVPRPPHAEPPFCVEFPAAQLSLPRPLSVLPCPPQHSWASHTLTDSPGSRGGTKAMLRQ